MKKNVLLMGTGLIGLAILSRFLPHPPNFAPITAVALFSSVWFSDKKVGLFLPLIIMFLSDLVLGLHNTLFFVYGSFVLMSVLGIWLKHNYSFGKAIGTGIAGSVLFFVITNFGVWLTSGGFYPMSFAGLVECYVAAIPFFHNTLFGDLTYVTLLFGSYELAKRLVPELQTQA